MPIHEQFTASYRRLPGPMVFLLALVMIPIGVILAAVVLIPALAFLLIGWVWATVTRLMSRARKALQMDGEGRRNVRVRTIDGSPDP